MMNERRITITGKRNGSSNYDSGNGAHQTDFRKKNKVTFLELPMTI